jgi:hypothetical protein
MSRRGPNVVLWHPARFLSHAHGSPTNTLSHSCSGLEALPSLFVAQFPPSYSSPSTPPLPGALTLAINAATGHARLACIALVPIRAA